MIQKHIDQIGESLDAECDDDKDNNEDDNDIETMLLDMKNKVSNTSNTRG